MKVQYCLSFLLSFFKLLYSVSMGGLMCAERIMFDICK
ncbi:hypothetical protein BACOVA_05368 [Bacteroides ovatus ATCC 8483]|uniref:Uncharacterized protein n=1 Tax=Bacteroides ovatus (strain ATCC 8483 / DSM 1896 / JCM 5824 / BCRC 10623 / CCUG 4943 / NCTC 11153) TaxID=411476 RepID=A0AAN3A4F2_BACO1|nr:hypothetical protein BACOVA_05368 [Bacteroides ovatus ATCC 8483]